MTKYLHYCFLMLIVLITSCSQSSIDETSTVQSKDSLPQNAQAVNEVANEPVFTTFIFVSDSLSKAPRYGYDILIDETKFIHQPYIPSIAGNKGFSSKENAEKTAQSRQPSTPLLHLCGLPERARNSTQHRHGERNGIPCFCRPIFRRDGPNSPRKPPKFC